MRIPEPTPSELDAMSVEELRAVWVKALDDIAQIKLQLEESDPVTRDPAWYHRACDARRHKNNFIQSVQYRIRQTRKQPAKSLSRCFVSAAHELLTEETLNQLYERAKVIRKRRGAP